MQFSKWIQICLCIFFIISLISFNSICHVLLVLVHCCSLDMLSLAAMLHIFFVGGVNGCAIILEDVRFGISTGVTHTMDKLCRHTQNPIRRLSVCVFLPFSSLTLFGRKKQLETYLQYWHYMQRQRHKSC